MARRFARLSPTPSGPPETVGLPDDGMCLSAFLVLHPPESPRSVLLGRVDPSGPWPEAGGMDRARLERVGDRWLLPATQLLVFESPEEAGARIARELLGRSDLAMSAPRVFSEAYRRRSTSQDPHWDLHFVFDAGWGSAPLDAARGRLWKELRFVDPGALEADALGRGHEDVLALAGFPARPPRERR